MVTSPQLSDRTVFDRVPLRELARFRPSTLRAEMSTVFQDFGQYQFTVRENVALGRIDAVDDDEAVRAAVRLAGATEFV